MGPAVLFRIPRREDLNRNHNRAIGKGFSLNYGMRGTKIQYLLSIRMRKLPFHLWIIPFLVLSASAAFAQTVYFQRFPAGTVSSVAPLGPATTLTDLASGLSNARAGGVETNGSDLIFYADRGAGQILAVDKSGNIYPIVLPFTALSNPQAISLDLTGNFLYVADVGNGRIVRVNLSVPLPTNKVQTVVDAGAGVTGNLSDLKYNPSDGHLYWTNDSTLHRASVRGKSMPVQSGETLITTNSIDIRFFDFDTGSPQTIFFSSGSGGFEGIYSSPIPPIGDTPNLNEVSVLSTSANPDVTITGIAIDKNGPFFCYTATSTPPAPAMRCGDRTTTPVSAFSEILNSQFTVPPNFMVIDSPSTVVRPDTRLGAPTLQLNLSIPKPAVLILLKQFDLAALNTIGRVISRATSGRIGFQYVVEVNKVRDASGKSVPAAKRDLRRMISKRNELTAKKLKSNSTYQVSYNIEITRKQKGQPVKVVKKTKLSPVSSFVVPR